MSRLDDMDVLGVNNAVVPIQISPTGEGVICARMFTPPDDAILNEYPPYHVGCGGFFVKQPERAAGTGQLTEVYECHKCFMFFLLMKGTRTYREVREQFSAPIPRQLHDPRMR